MVFCVALPACRGQLRITTGAVLDGTNCRTNRCTKRKSLGDFSDPAKIKRRQAFACGGLATEITVSKKNRGIYSFGTMSRISRFVFEGREKRCPPSPFMST
jgi:hypothetical protein